MSKKRIEPDKIRRIKEMREKGFSLPEISRLLGISKTTVFRYIKGVKILPEFRENWKIKRGGSRSRKLLKLKQAQDEAEQLIKDLSYKEKLLVLSALYWAEGSKRDFCLSNTNPALIKVFVRGLREVWGIDDSRFRISIRLYEDLDREKSLSFWSKIIEIPKEKFAGVNILPGKKKGRLEYGMCRLRITRGGDLLKKIDGINKVVTNIIAPIA